MSGCWCFSTSLPERTDPEAGAALACAVVKTLVERGTAVAVTTHYEALKALAAERDDMHNAAVGFDFENMAPTFRMTLGVPGELERARGRAAIWHSGGGGRPGARTLLPDESRSFESLVAKLEAATEAALRKSTRPSKKSATS